MALVSSHATATPTPTPTPDWDATATHQADMVQTSVAATLTALPTPTPTRTPTRPPTRTPQPTDTPAPSVEARRGAFGDKSLLGIAWTVGDVGKTDIHVAGIDGDSISSRRGLAVQSCDEAEPGWSSDGASIVYHSNCAGSYDLYLADAAGEWTFRVTYDAATDEREPDFAPDGQWIIYRANAHDPNDRQDRNRNHDGDLRVVRPDGSDGYSLGIQGKGPAWSPDGDSIAFMSERTGSWDVYVFDLESGQTRQITECAEDCRWPHWSDDGGSIVFNTAIGVGRVPQEIQIVAAVGGQRRTLVSGETPGRPQWATNGRIVFNSAQGIEVVGLDGSGRAILIAGGQNWGAAIER